MKVLKSAEQDLDRDGSGELAAEEGFEEDGSAPWSLLPGAVSWDYSTGGEGNTVNRHVYFWRLNPAFACLLRRMIIALCIFETDLS